MKNFAGISCLITLLAVNAGSQSIPKELLSAPASLTLDRPTMEAKAGSTVSSTVMLRNAANQPVASPSDLVLSAETPSGTQAVVLPRGQSSVTFSWRATSAGIGRTTVRAGKLHPANGLVVVAPKPVSEMMMLAPVAAMQHPVMAHPAQGAAAVVAQPAPHNHVPLGAIIGAHVAGGAPPAAQPAGQPAQPPPPAAAPAPPQATKLQLFVTPLAVLESAAEHRWKADVSIAAFGEHDELLPVGATVQVHLTSDFGRFSPPDIVLQPGDISTFDKPVILTADRPGKDAVQAISSLGTAGPLEVDYLQPPPTQLLLSFGPPQLLGSGAASATVQVCLGDDAGAPATSAKDIQVVLTAAGQLSKSVVPIAAGFPCGEQVTWTSRAGNAEIVADSGDLKKAMGSLVFPQFPWYLVWLAALGGVVGAIVLHSEGLFSRQWWSHTWRGLLIGAVLGSFVYLLARFGALVLPSSIPVAIQNIPTVSGLGSFLLGFIGGIFGRRLFKIDDDRSSPEPPAAAGHAAGKE